MFFYMNVRRQAPVIMPNVVKQEQQPKQPKQPKQQRQVVTVHEARIIEPMVLHESNEIGEICDNNKKQIIIYNIGHEDVQECFPLPVLEEPVIETLSKPVELMVEDKVGEDAEAHVNKPVVEDMKKKNNNNNKKNTRK